VVLKEGTAATALPIYWLGRDHLTLAQQQQVLISQNVKSRNDIFPNNDNKYLLNFLISWFDIAHEIQ
jgi:hypothetical protein